MAVHGCLTPAAEWAKRLKQGEDGGEQKGGYSKPPSEGTGRCSVRLAADAAQALAPRLGMCDRLLRRAHVFEGRGVAGDFGEAGV
jgi:hypothetical protein